LGPSVIGVIGLGYVGLPLAVEFAGTGSGVIGFDVDGELVERLSSGESHVLDVPSGELSAALSGSLRVSSSSSDLSECDTFVICVPTPLAASGMADTSSVERAVEVIAPWIRAGSLVVLESTSYPGTTEEVVAAPLAAATGLVAGEDFCVGFSPERIDPGNSDFGVANTPKIVSGLQKCCWDRVDALYSRAGVSVVPAGGVREAEFAKLLENTYRQVNIALVNEMAKFTRALGVDLREAIRLASTKPFGFAPFYPGPGVGGHCIPIDPQYLASRVASELGEEFRFVALAREINAGMPEYVVSRLALEMSSAGIALDGGRVLLLGVSYKRDVPDMREAPAEEIVRLLRKEGASVSYFDPYVDAWAVDGESVERMDSLTFEELRFASGFDGVVLVTDHSVFHGQDYSGLAPVVLDTRGVLSGESVAHL